MFFAAATALVVSTALGVLAGQFLTTVVSEKALHWIAGLGFVAIGFYTLWRA